MPTLTMLPDVKNSDQELKLQILSKQIKGIIYVKSTRIHKGQQPTMAGII